MRHVRDYSYFGSLFILMLYRDSHRIYILFDSLKHHRHLSVFVKITKFPFSISVNADIYYFTNHQIVVLSLICFVIAIFLDKNRFNVHLFAHSPILSFLSLLQHQFTFLCSLAWSASSIFDWIIYTNSSNSPIIQRGTLFSTFEGHLSLL